MFLSANEFNKNLDSWDTSKLTSMRDTFNGADKFTYDIGGNKTGNEVGSIKTYQEFVSLLDVNLPDSGTNTKSLSKIVFEDKLNQLYEVTVKKEDDGNNETN